MDFDEIIFNVVMFGFIGGAVFVLVGLCFGWYNPVDSTNQSVVLFIFLQELGGYR